MTRDGYTRLGLIRIQKRIGQHWSEPYLAWVTKYYEGFSHVTSVKDGREVLPSCYWRQAKEAK